MKQGSITGNVLKSGGMCRIGCTAAAGSLLGVFFLFCLNVPLVSAIDKCNTAQMQKCGGCDVGRICCTRTTPGGCLPEGSTNCKGTMCALSGGACGADACITVPQVQDCTKSQMKNCGACAVGDICCTATGKCSNGKADCSGLPCGDSTGTCDTAKACRTVKKVADCSPPQNVKCIGCATGVVCCPDTAGCAPADQADCLGLAAVCRTSPDANTCSANACSTVALTCPNASHMVTFKNNSSTEIWLAAIPGCRPGGNCSAPIPEPAGGWGIEANGGHVDLTVPSCWSGGFILRESCRFTKTGNTYTCDKSPCCDVGDCNNGNKSAYTCNSGGEAPVTRIEVTFDGGYDADGKKINSLVDYYDISYVDGWSKMATMEPTGNKIWPDNPPDGDAKYWCKQGGCSAGTVTCPDKLVKCKVDGQTKTPLACWSPGKYAALHKDDMEKGSLVFPKALRADLGCVCDPDADVKCNLGTAENPQINPLCNKPDNTTFGCSPYSEPGKSNINSQCCPWASTDARSETCGWDAAHSARVWPQWARDYVTDIKTQCPNAYAWQYDDLSSTYRCEPDAAHIASSVVNYLVTIHDVNLSSSSCK